MEAAGEKEAVIDSDEKHIGDEKIVSTEDELIQNKEAVVIEDKTIEREEIVDPEALYTADSYLVENKEKLSVDDEEVEDKIYDVEIECEDSLPEAEEDQINSELSSEKEKPMELYSKIKLADDTKIEESSTINGILPAFENQTKTTEIILYPPTKDLPPPKTKRVLVLKPEPSKQFSHKPQRVERKRTRSITCTFIIIALLLCLITISYLIGGSWLFLCLEEVEEVSYIRKFSKLKNDTAILLATELRQVKAHEAIWSQYVFKHLDIFEEAILKSTGLGYWRQDISEGKKRWVYPNTMFYSLSLMTTTGYSSMTPRSKWGRTTTVCYSLFGIPLMLSWLICMGHFSALCWSWMFDSICCRFCWFNSEDDIAINKQSPRNKITRTKRNSIAPAKDTRRRLTAIASTNIEDKTPEIDRILSAGSKFQNAEKAELSRAYEPIGHSFSNKSPEAFRGNFEDSIVDSKLNDLDHVVSIVFAVLFFVVYFVFGSAVVALTEQLSITDVLYFNYLMFVSMGPGCYELQDDITENKIKGNLCYIIYLIFGYITLSMIFNLVYMYFYPSSRIYQSRKTK